MRATHVFAGVAVSEFAGARDWYERVFGAPPDSLPKDGEAVWHLAATASIYVTVDPARAGHCLVTLAVENLDELRAGLSQRGLSAEDGAEDNGLRTLCAADPDGNMIKFFEDPAGP